MKLDLRRIPLQIAVGAFLAFLLTAGSGVSASNLGLAAKLAGWDRQPMVGAPLVWLCTLPLRVLPGAWIPLGLNLLAAASGAVLLGLLARTLELVSPHHSGAARSARPRRLPALLAAAVCGLEFHFWQCATAATSEMLDLLLLAVPLWCVLEFRALDHRRWLQVGVFVWGLGLTENWLLLLALPLFVLGIAWLRPLLLLRRDYLLPLVAWGLTGCCVGALLPLANALLPEAPSGFGALGLDSLRAAKNLLLGLYVQFWRAHRLITLAVLIFYLVPLVSCLLRPNENTTGHTWLEGGQIWFFHAVRAALLLLCVWQAFDPAAGPRGILKHQLNLTLPLLSFDYLNGLAAGFLTARLLGLHWPWPRSALPRHSAIGGLAPGREHATFPALAGLLLATTAGLAALNLPAILLASRHPLTEFGEMALRSLPPTGGIILSDFPDKLAAFQAAQSRHADARAWLAVDTRSLPTPAYRQRLQARLPGFWMLSTNQHHLSPAEIMQLVQGLARTHRLFCLHQPVGGLAELFNLEPVGPIIELKSLPTNAISPPPVPPPIVAQNEAVWNAFTPEIDLLQPAGLAGKPATRPPIAAALRLEAVAPDGLALLAEWYSMALNEWGVALQRAGYVAAARRRLTQALALDDDNWIARANLFCNTRLQTGAPMDLTEVDRLAGQLGNRRTLGLALERFGPADEPAFCYLLGNACAQSILPRLALQNLERAAALAPNVLAPRLALAALYSHYQMTELAEQSIRQLHHQVTTLPGAPGIETGLSLLEAGNFLSQSNLAGARRIFASMLQQHPRDAALEKGIMRAYVTMGDFTNAEQVAQLLLASQPDDLDALLADTGILLQTGRPAEAIPLLNRVLAFTNSLPATFNRAVAYLQTQNYPAARADYLKLQGLPAYAGFVNLGLGDIALRQNNTNLAIQYFLRCLSNAPATSPECIQARTRLDALPPLRPPITAAAGASHSP